MSVQVDVDLGSAVVVYRPAVGEKRSVPVQDISRAAVLKGAPWRTFRWYFGQRHYSGTWWSSTERDHVIYESRLEWANLLLADFDPSVHHIAAQPFMLRAQVNGQVRRHTVDYLWDTDDGPVVVDVVRAERSIQPSIVHLCAWTREIVESLDWSYRVVSEPPRIRLANIRYLAGYRREWLLNDNVLREMRSCRGQFAGMSIADAERTMVKFARPLVRPALMHLLWCHEYGVDLDKPICSSTVLEVSG